MPPPTQGPKAGRHWPVELSEYDDPNTGARVRRVTDYPATDNRHLYFTEPGWYDDGRRLLFRGYRDEPGTDRELPDELTLPRQLYSLDSESGLITQVTDMPAGLTSVTRSHDTPEAFFWSDNLLVAVELDTLAVRSLYEKPSGFTASKPGVTADDETVCVAVVDPAADGSDTPHSRIIAVPTDGGDAEVLHEADTRLSHVNPSPTKPDLLTFCHEGSWGGVDQRIWGYDRASGETWPIRPQAENEAVGHEYWHADGETLGFHGWRGERPDHEPFAGHIRYDNEEHFEWPAPEIHTHFHCNDRSLVVGDGTHNGIPYNLLWKFDEDAGEYRGPRMLATTDWRNGGRTGPGTVHPHSQIGPEGEVVVFDSDRGGIGSDVYIVDIPPFEDLPLLAEA